MAVTPICSGFTIGQIGGIMGHARLITIALLQSMKRTLSQDWSEAELSRLKDMVRRKVDAQRIAIALGRYVGPVKKKIRELKLVPSKTVR